MKPGWLYVMLTTALVAGCGSAQPPTAPSAAPPAASSAPPPSTVSFSELAGTNATPFTSHAELGYLVESVSGDWTVLATYGRPLPSIKLVNPAAAVELTGAVRVTAGGATFRLASVDLYSSVTTIPYTLTGTLAGNRVFAGHRHGAKHNWQFRDGDQSVPECAHRRVGLDRDQSGQPIVPDL